MRIEDNRAQANDTYGKLRDGECFAITDCGEEIVCIKVCVFDEHDRPCDKAINLENGVEPAIDLKDDTPVQKLSARITIW